MKHLFSDNRRGSSLLVAILVMGILLTLTLGLSSLVIREITQTSDVVAAGKAYFAAEAGIENALLDLNQHLPGYQTKGLTGATDEWLAVKDTDIDYRYRIRNKGDKFPYFDADQPIYLTPGVGKTKDYLYSGTDVGALRATYNVLALNDTVTIPLFTDCGDGTSSDVKDFLLEYFVDFDLDPNLEWDLPTYGDLATKLENFDVLRWKVFGEPVNPDSTGGLNAPSRTHAISDFYPANTNDSPSTPVCIGTDLSLGEGCLIPAAKFVKNDAEYISDYSTSPSAYEDIINVWSQARQCYKSDVGSGTDIQNGCSIKTFIDNHKKNYLTITNIVNPGIIGISNPLLRAQRANIYYRVIAKGDPNNACPNPNPSQIQNDQDVMVREYADVSADGFASDEKVKQSIDVKLKLNSFLPVFSFSLYNADPTKTGNEAAVRSLL